MPTTADELVSPGSATASPSVSVAANPTPRGERITSVDVLRGFALLGILLMNIVGFGLYFRAYDNPTSAGGADGANLWIWIVLHVLAEGKMRCLFSLVFGASMVLLTSRLEGRPDAADIYYRRTIWLLIFGIAHAFLLWQGDILYPYALCGLVLYPFRNLKPRTLLIIGLSLMVFLSGFNILRGYWRVSDKDEAMAAIAKEKAGQTLTTEEKDAKDNWEKMLKRRNPDEDFLRKDAAGWQGGVLSVIKARGKLVNDWHAGAYYNPGNFDIWGMMFIGMALLKFGVLAATKPLRFYVWLMCGGYLVGGAINAYTALLIVNSHFDPVVHLYSFCVYDLGRLGVALGHMGLLLILCQRGWLQWLTMRLGAVGQMALSNYIMTSTICAVIFTGYGFRMYGELQRYQLYYVVAGISIFQLIASPIWLKYYRFGPLEWCWRALTYWQKPPMRLAPKPVAPTPEPALQTS